MPAREDEDKRHGLTAEIFGYTEDDIQAAIASGEESPAVETFSFGGMAPRISIQNEILETAYGKVSKSSTITVNGVLFGEPLTEEELAENPPTKPIDKLMEAQDDLYDDITSYKRFKFNITDAYGTIVRSFYNCKLNTLDFEEGSWLGWCKFTASFKSESSVETTFLEHTENFSTSSEDGLGYIDLSDKTIATRGHTTATYKITARVSEVDRGMAELMEYWELSNGDTYNSGGVVWNVYVTSSETSSSPTTGQISLTQTLILVPNQAPFMTAIASYNESRESSADSAASVLSISGEFKSLVEVSESVRYEHFKEFADKIFSNALNSSLLGDTESLRGFSGDGTNDEWDIMGSALKKSATLDRTTNVISYQVDYDISNYDFIITNATKQDVNISLTPQRNVFAAIPVIGKLNGPRLQNTNSVTEALKTLNLDVTFVNGSNNNSEWESIADLLSRHEPQALTNYYDQKQIFSNIESETYDPTNNTYSLTANWTYLPARLQTFAPAYSDPIHLSKAPVLPTLGSLETGGGWYKDEDFKDGGDTMLPHSRVFKFVNQDNFDPELDENGDPIEDTFLRAIHNPISQSRFLENEGHIGEYGNKNGAVHLLNIFIHNDDQDELSTSLTLKGEDASRFEIREAPQSSYNSDWETRGAWKALYLTGQPLYPLPHSGVSVEEGETLAYKTKYVANIYSKNTPASESLSAERGQSVTVYEHVRYNLFVHKEWKQPKNIVVQPSAVTLHSDIFRQDYFVADVSLDQHEYDASNESSGGIRAGHATFYLKNNPRGMFKIVRTGRYSAKLFIRSGVVHQEWEPDEIIYDDETGEVSEIIPHYMLHTVEIGAKDLSTEKEMMYDDDGEPILDDDGEHKEKILKTFFTLRIKKPDEVNILGEFNIQPMGQIQGDD